MNKTALLTLTVALGVLTAPLALAVGTPELELITTTTSEVGTSYSASITSLVLMTLLAFLPMVIFTMTPYLRISIVLTIMRQALGLNTTPNTKVLVSIAVALSLFIMAPVVQEIGEKAYTPFSQGQISLDIAIERGAEPLRQFMLNHTMPSYLETFLQMSGQEYTTKEEVPLIVLWAAFVSSEIQTALTIGFFIFLPFVIIDMLVASVLMSLGMMMVSPMMISQPVKILLFVLVDGWILIVDGLSKSFFIG
ncbi:flagellar type III secretion system pore protein FliP [Vibrio coralliirubri]|uniref:flagellar type III secretion system pore protein FliP n=1 Tax=Vibrio coralliirubri TaxID=1516159 RepID=UPI00228530DC|nr:flagellar type III secretion system pore protein FliP [Vibrio coralliirubri]MCY9860963.1 flagellar type III secretion system pore protein FliP [Vibrio coralliirubri]